MKNIYVLDCTLRDGGYCNNWTFGEKNIHRVIKGLMDAGIDMIECGFLTNKVKYQKDVTRFTSLFQLNEYVPLFHEGYYFVIMVNFGEYAIEDIPYEKEVPVEGIRVTFHKKDRYNATLYCKALKEKGYKVFVQPMVSMNYSDEEFMDLLHYMNQIQPYACYIVDSFGTMKKRELLHYYLMMEAFLNPDIYIGFHSHNNIQSALSNAQVLMEQQSVHNIIIDTSIYGMGRGAGNLNSELFLGEMNMEYPQRYSIKPLLQVMDQVINHFYEIRPWGYSLPNYLSATHLIHPNYANYLSEKNTLTVEAIDNIFAMMDADKRTAYDPKYIEKIYIQYMSQGTSNKAKIDDLKDKLCKKNVLLIAPGKSIVNQEEFIKSFIDENTIVIGINHDMRLYECDYIFVSNMRRFQDIDTGSYSKCIITSNINTSDYYAMADYYALIDSSSSIPDNAGMMAIKLLIDIGVREVWLAGYDGYTYNHSENYENQEIELVMENSQIDKLNSGMQMTLKKYKEKIKLHFLTKSIFQK